MQGYVYQAAEAANHPMAAAAPGKEITAPGRMPPWIVVHHALDAVVVDRWPGKLWRVEMVDEAASADHRSAGISLPVLGARFTRAVGVRVIEEMPVTSMFGAHGRAVQAVIAVAETMDAQRAAALSAALHPQAGQAYTRAFNRWRGSPEDGQNMTGVVSVSGNKSGSPIGAGFVVVAQMISARARELLGDAATERDVHGDVWLSQPWSNAMQTLLDAALAFGAPEILQGDEQAVLATAWRKVIGADPPG